MMKKQNRLLAFASFCLFAGLFMLLLSLATATEEIKIPQTGSRLHEPFLLTPQAQIKQSLKFQEGTPMTSGQSQFRYSPNYLYINTTAIPYRNAGEATGQEIINNDPGGIAATWGGAATQSGSDGLNTHIIGHSPGVFEVLFQLNVNDTLTITDLNGAPTTYRIKQILRVDHQGVEPETDTNYWEQITSTAGGERITLQTCINRKYNLIIFADAV